MNSFALPLALCFRLVVAIPNNKHLDIATNATFNSSASRQLFPEPLPELTCPARLVSDAFDQIGAFFREHEGLMENVITVTKAVSLAVTMSGVEMKLAERFFAGMEAVELVHEKVPGFATEATPIFPLGAGDHGEAKQRFDCLNERMGFSFEAASLGNSELFYFNRLAVDLSMHAVPFLQHCGPLPGGHWTEEAYVATDVDKAPLQHMCATAMHADHLNLCLGTGNIMMTYLDTASRAHAQAMNILDGLRDIGVSATTPKYGKSAGDEALLQLIEGPFFWRFGQPRVAAMLTYAQLVASCYTERPEGLTWGAEDGAIGWSSLKEVKESLALLVREINVDIDDVHDGLAKAALRAALRIYKQKHIEVYQDTVCKTKNKKHAKVYVLLRDNNPNLANLGIDLSQTSSDYTGVPYNVARTCFPSSNKCNKLAKNKPMYAQSNSLNWPGAAGASNTFAVGCYNAGNDKNDEESEYLLGSQAILDYWQPQHSIPSHVAAIGRLDGPLTDEYTVGEGIGYGVDYYLDKFIKPLYKAKYDEFFRQIKSEMHEIVQNVINPMQEVLDKNEAAFIKYTQSRSRNSGLRVKDLDQELLSATRLSVNSTQDLSPGAGGRRLLLV